MKRPKLRRPRFHPLRDTIKWATTYVAAIAVIFALLPAESQSAVLQFIGVPEKSVTAVIGVLFILARLWKQGPREDESGPDSTVDSQAEGPIDPPPQQP